MAFNGSGTFLINSTGQPVVANTVISATVFNALTADLASGLTNCITKDGQSTPTANIPMGSNKITGLANGTLINDAATLGQVQTTAAKLITSVSGADTVTGIMSPTLTAYAAGQLFYFVAAGANTGAVTLNIDGLGAKAVTRDGSTALAAGDIQSGEMVVVIYDGTRFQMINAANSFGNTTINGTLTVTGNTGLQANVSITSTLSVGGTFAVTGAATLGSTLSVTGKSDLPTVSTASINAAVAVVTTGTVTNLTSTSASIASVNAGVALLTTATVTDLTATGASIASANIGNLQFTAASIASINAGVAVVTNLTATSASIASANVGTAVVTTGTVTNLTSTSASIASANAAVALVTTGTVTNLTSTAASIASANLGNAVVTTLTATGASVASANAGVANVSDLRVVGASVTSANIGTALVTRLDVTGASAASINAGVALVTTGTVTNLTATGASIASANVGTGVVTTLTATQASVGSINAAVALVTNGTVTTLSGTQASITSINHAVVRLLGSSSGYVGLQGAAAAGSTTYTLPSTDGSNGQILTTNGSAVLSWVSPAGGGDVVGPASATDNAITRFDQTTGKLIQNSTVILDDAGTITGVASLAAVTASITSANAATAVITTLTVTGASIASANMALGVFNDGTSTAPSITNNGDTNTGAYFPAADEMAVTTGGTVAAAFNSNGLFFRNRIINGDMRIDQRNAGASVTPTSNQYTIDRYQFALSQTSKLTTQQNAGSVTPPTGFVNYFGITSSSAYSVLSGDYFFVKQIIEGTNVADLGWGAAGALTVTMSFWVRSSLTGTFGGSIRNSAFNRSYPFSYTISSANTWEYKTVTIPGDTTGTWLTTTGVGLDVSFSFGTGSTYSGTAGAWAAANYVSATGAVSVVGTNAATWYITGVQLETGSTATPFERRPYGTELMLCQRYCVLIASGANKPIANSFYYSATNVSGYLSFPVDMRATPTLSVVSGTNYYGSVANGGIDSLNSLTQDIRNERGITLYNNTEAAGTAGHAGYLYSANAAGQVLVTAEL
jgi:hypothetical protein